MKRIITGNRAYYGFHNTWYPFEPNADKTGLSLRARDVDDTRGGRARKVEVFERLVITTIFGGVLENNIWRRMNHKLTQLYGKPSNRNDQSGEVSV